MSYNKFKNILIYGAGTAGQDVKKYLEKQGYGVTAFLDENTTLISVDDLRVFTSKAWVNNYKTTNTCVIIGLFNNYIDVGEIVDNLEKHGFLNIFSLVEFVRDFPSNQPFRYWLVPPSFYDLYKNNIINFRNHLEDEVSRELLDRIFEFRITGNYRCLPKPSEKQYFPDDLPAWPQPLKYIDCGAYIGDTLQAMIDAGLKFEAVATFEPNCENYQILVNNFKYCKTSHFPCGVSSDNRKRHFDSTLGPGGHLIADLEVNSDAYDLVLCVRLDDALPEFGPNLIKMDIEGEELAALQGAEAMLREYSPNLAISIYHRAEHLWSIFEYLLALDLGYLFYLRCHAYSSFDTVLYALAPNSSN